MPNATTSRFTTIISILIVSLLLSACTAAAATAGVATGQQQDWHGQRNVPYSFQPLSAHAIPNVAIIGTAKGGTTDLYTLLTRTSRMAPGSQKKRMKEAKMLIEVDRNVTPGHTDFHEYLLRIGHPCAASTHPQHSTAGAFQDCMRQLAANNSNSSQLPLSIDATPIYLALPQAVTALRRVSHGDAKVILLLRHPVDRAESLYNHRVNTEHNRHLPPRVMNHAISEWANLFLDWVDATPTAKQLLSALTTQTDPQQQSQIYQQLVDLNILGLPDGLPLTFANYNRHGHIERNIFGNTVYAAALAPWRAGYFRPGRVMVIDSHTFFARRLEVLDQVYRFVHGRPLSTAGRHIAQRTALQNARRARGVQFPGANFDAVTRQRISQFYTPLNELLLGEVLPAMRREGALVVGFEGPPWVAVQQ